MKHRRSSMNRIRLYAAVLLILFSVMAAERASSGTHKFVRPFRPDDTLKSDDRGATSDAPAASRTSTRTDSQGVLPMTDDISKVPPEHRTVPSEPEPAPQPARRKAPDPAAAPGQAATSPAHQP